MEEKKALANKTILLVEDDELISKMYSKRFSSDGALVLVAYDGEQGLEILKKQKVDLVLLDLGMPGMDGYEMFKKMKANKKIKDIPVIILSNTTMNEKREEFREIVDQGVQNIFRKYEVPLEELSTQLREYFST